MERPWLQRPWYIVKEEDGYVILPKERITERSKIVVELPPGLTWLYSPAYRDRRGNLSLEEIKKDLLRRARIYKVRLSSLEQTLREL